LRDGRRAMHTETRELVRLARNVLFTRKDAHAHLPRAKADIEVREAEREFWDYATRVMGSQPDRDQLAQALAAGGVPSEQALRWSTAIVHDEDDDGVELDPPELCAHCGSGMRGKTVCSVCGQPRGSAPQADDESDETRAARLVRMLVAKKRLELVSAHAENAVVGVTVEVLAEHGDDEPPAIAAALEEAWIDHDDVAEVFAETDEIVQALRDT
jgi:hypothetical protein